MANEYAEIDEVERQFDATTVEYIRRAIDAFHHLQETSRASFSYWMTVAEGIHNARQEIVRIKRLNAANGAVYARLMSQWLHKTGLKTVIKDSGTLARFQLCFENRAAIQAWLDTVDPIDRLNWNHPNTVWRHYQESLGNAPKRVTTPRATKDAEILRLKDELDAAHGRLTQLGIENGDVWVIGMSPHDNPGAPLFRFFATEKAAEKAAEEYVEPYIEFGSVEWAGEYGFNLDEWTLDGDEYLLKPTDQEVEQQINQRIEDALAHFNAEHEREVSRVRLAAFEQGKLEGQATAQKQDERMSWIDPLAPIVAEERPRQSADRIDSKKMTSIAERIFHPKTTPADVLSSLSAWHRLAYGWTPYEVISGNGSDGDRLLGQMRKNLDLTVENGKLRDEINQLKGEIRALKIEVSELKSNPRKRKSIRAERG